MSISALLSEHKSRFFHPCTPYRIAKPESANGIKRGKLGWWHSEQVEDAAIEHYTSGGDTA
jgi:hypothetical protein